MPRGLPRPASQNFQSSAACGAAAQRVQFPNLTDGTYNITFPACQADSSCTTADWPPRIHPMAGLRGGMPRSHGRYRRKRIPFRWLAPPAEQPGTRLLLLLAPVDALGFEMQLVFPKPSTSAGGPGQVRPIRGSLGAAIGEWVDGFRWPRCQPQNPGTLNIHYLSTRRRPLIPPQGRRVLQVNA